MGLHGKTPSTTRVLKVSVPCFMPTLWLAGARRKEERASQHLLHFSAADIGEMSDISIGTGRDADPTTSSNL